VELVDHTSETSTEKPESDALLVSTRPVHSSPCKSTRTRGSIREMPFAWKFTIQTEEVWEILIMIPVISMSMSTVVTTSLDVRKLIRLPVAYAVTPMLSGPSLKLSANKSPPALATEMTHVPALAATTNAIIPFRLDLVCQLVSAAVITSLTKCDSKK